MIKTVSIEEARRLKNANILWRPKSDLPESQQYAEVIEEVKE